jgi:hypothetical protein
LCVNGKYCHKKAILASVEKRRQAQQAQRSRSLRGRPLRLNSRVRATRPTQTIAPTIAFPSGPRQQPLTRWFGPADRPQEPASESDDSSYLLPTGSHSSSSDPTSILGLSSDSSMSESNPESEDSSTDDSSRRDYLSDEESSQFDYSSDGTSSHLDLPQRPLLVALQSKYLAMTKTHRRTVTSRGRGGGEPLDE